MRFVVKVKKDQLKELVRAAFTDPAVTEGFGFYLLGKVQAQFDTQQGWPPRAVPSAAGIVSDLSRGGQVKERRFDPRPALVDTGVLKNSWQVAVEGRRITLYSDVDYAEKHAKGGVSTVEVGPSFRRNFYEASKRDPRLRKVAWLWGKTKKSRVLTVNLPARPYLTLGDEDIAVLEELVSGNG